MLVKSRIDVRRYSIANIYENLFKFHSKEVALGFRAYVQGNFREIHKILEVNF